jgi:hypothetical protein
MSHLSAKGFLAPDQADQYIQALLDLLGDDDPVEVLKATPATLARELAAFPADKLRTPEAPGKWSAFTVFAHLADTELVASFRLRMILAHDRPELTAYDQDLWASRLHYDRTTPEENIARFTALRVANIHLFGGASADELARVGLHGERGEESVDRLCRLAAGHDRAHLRQLARIRAALS